LWLIGSSTAASGSAKKWQSTEPWCPSCADSPTSRGCIGRSRRAGCRLDAAPGSVRGRLLCPALDASLRGGRQPLTGCQRSGASAWGLREFGFHGLSHSWVAGASCLRPAQTACGSSPGTSEWGLCAIRTAVDRHHDVSHAARGPGDGRPLWQRQSGAASFMAARARGDRRKRDGVGGRGGVRVSGLVDSGDMEAALAGAARSRRRSRSRSALNRRCGGIAAMTAALDGLMAIGRSSSARLGSGRWCCVRARTLGWRARRRSTSRKHQQRTPYAAGQIGRRASVDQTSP
jgi:hypothetical protein